MNDQAPISKDGWEVCEIVATQMAVTIPGPFAGLHTWCLWFSATKDGRMDQHPIHQKEAGQIPEREMQRLSAQGLANFEENPARATAIEKLAKELEADGWEYFGKGEYWFSRRFRREHKTEVRKTKEADMTNVANSVRLQFVGGLKVFVQAFANAAYEQTVTIAPPTGTPAVFRGNGEGNVPLKLVTPGFLSPGAGGRCTVLYASG